LVTSSGAAAADNFRFCALPFRKEIQLDDDDDDDDGWCQKDEKRALFFLMLIPCSCGEASEPQRGVAVAAAAAAAMAILTIACEAEGKEKDEALGPQRQSCYVPSGYVTRSPGKYNRRVVVFSPFCVTLPVWYVFSATRYHLPYSAESFFLLPID
jgi:hypothetical protein